MPYLTGKMFVFYTCSEEATSSSHCLDLPHLKVNHFSTFDSMHLTARVESSKRDQQVDGAVHQQLPKLYIGFKP